MNRFSHVAILVSDLDRAMRWYADVLGWVQSFRLRFDDGSLGDANGFTGAGGEVAMGLIGDVQVEFVRMDLDAEPPPSGRGTGLMLMTVVVPDLETVKSACRRWGLPIAREVLIGGSTCLIVVDPDGTELAVVPEV